MPIGSPLSTCAAASSSRSPDWPFPIAWPLRNSARVSIPTGLRILPDGRLLVTLGGINAVAIVAPGDAENPVQALIPTGWYPSAVATSAQWRPRLRRQPQEPAGPQPAGLPARARHLSRPARSLRRRQPIYLSAREGGPPRNSRCPTSVALAATTLQVAQNIGLPGRRGTRRCRGPRWPRSASAIKHVVFIIKENRTYDQVLGDLTSATAIRTSRSSAQALTPNHHRLARQFVTLDNFYDSGEVSSTGWTWSTAAPSHRPPREDRPRKLCRPRPCL